MRDQHLSIVLLSSTSKLPQKSKFLEKTSLYRHPPLRNSAWEWPHSNFPEMIGGDDKFTTITEETPKVSIQCLNDSQYTPYSSSNRLRGGILMHQACDYPNLSPGMRPQSNPRSRINTCSFHYPCNPTTK